MNIFSFIHNIFEPPLFVNSFRCNELNRETFLAAMGFQVVSFAYDDAASRPELCITLLRLMLNR
ncbi:hypothetical protein EHV15_18905 [Paenibacillus oralis]|uniref:Uncharacterized protein n=1 Tax=Paenibacillus oralis TaxID=2490856 RepID=A0A3P3U333_9BACL|nr:hypothetical protein EHV15_18905 [Paenibacillus oralis]